MIKSTVRKGLIFGLCVMTCMSLAACSKDKQPYEDDGIPYDDVMYAEEQPEPDNTVNGIVLDEGELVEEEVLIEDDALDDIEIEYEEESADDEDTSKANDQKDSVKQKTKNEKKSNTEG